MFDEALERCPDVTIISEYLDYMQRLYDDDVLVSDEVIRYLQTFVLLCANQIIVNYNCIG